MLQIKLLDLYKINVGNYSFHIVNDRQHVQCGVKRLLKKFMQYGDLVINKLYELMCK